MLRQLARLTRPLDRVPGAVAIAVYSDDDGRPIAAAERGYEGVACVDDAARALALLSDLSAATRVPVLRAWAVGLLEFLLYMQEPDGRFVNFVSDWTGTKNEHGPTSRAGGSFWQARGLHGLARAWLALEDDRAGTGVVRGLAIVRDERVAAAIRAIHILTAVDLLEAGRAPDVRADLEAWCSEVAACRSDGVLFDDPDESQPHLWAHVQEGALARAGAFLGRDDLVEIARSSALGYLAPLIDSGFDLPTVQPDGVASALFGVETLAAVTREPRFEQLAERARAWFDAQDQARPPVYDRAAGRVHDGVDSGVLNRHSGAESNIAGAQAFFSELAIGVRDQATALERLVPALDAVATRGSREQEIRLGQAVSRTARRASAVASRRDMPSVRRTGLPTISRTRARREGSHGKPGSRPG